METIKTSPVGKTSIRNNRQGFTLIELLVVLSILGLSMMLVLPRFTGAMQSARVKTALRDAADLFRKAHAHSVLKRKEWHVRVDMEKGEFTLVVSPEDKDAENDVNDEEKSGTVLTLSLPEDLKVDSVKTGLDSRVKVKKKNRQPKDIIFYPLGNSSGGRVLLHDKNERTYAIEINPLNGRVLLIHDVEKRG
jgi:type II secretion system protein H